MSTTISKREISLPAPNNWELSATLFENPDELEVRSPVVLISAAAAMPQGFYAEFAKHLIESGAKAVLTYDYRGIGGSAGKRERWPELRMKDWALLDFPCAAEALKSRYPNHPLVGIGHSFGGQALGLSGISSEFERYVTLATMSGYWRDLDEPYGVYFKSQIVGAAFAKVLGYIPHWGGLGEAMPGTIFLDWTRWIRKKDYFFSDPELPETARFNDVTLPLLSIGLADDTWGTHPAVVPFMEHYTNADLRFVWLSPKASGPIGHFSFFRPRHRDLHWSAAVDFLLRETWPDEAKR